MLSIEVTLHSLLKAYVKKAVILLLTTALVIFAWSGVYFQANAHAATMSGVSDRVEGTVDEYVGKVKRAKGDVTDDLPGEVKGGLQEVKGKAQQNVGIAKNKLDDAGNSIEDKSESLIDSVKDFFE